MRSLPETHALRSQSAKCGRAVMTHGSEFTSASCNNLMLSPHTRPPPLTLKLSIHNLDSLFQVRCLSGVSVCLSVQEGSHIQPAIIE